jgi:hypothetical protein
MHIKRYTIASLIFIVLVGWYIFAYITQNTISIDFFGIQLPSLSIALWTTIPLVILYIASVLHISFYSMLGSLKLRKYEKDFDTLVDSIAEAYLGKENRKHSFKTDRYKFLGELVDNTIFFPSETLSSHTSNEKINSVITLINDVKNGNVVDLKKYSLSTENDIVIHNERNRYKKGEVSAENILNHSTKYANSLCEEVYADYVKTASLNMIDKYKRFLTKTALYDLLARINSDENSLEIINDVLIDLFSLLDLDKKDFMEISLILSKKMVPEQRMRLFEILSEKSEKAMDAYLFTLFDLEMLSAADEILENSQDDEYMNFKAYRELKESNKHFNIDLFI